MAAVQLGTSSGATDSAIDIKVWQTLGMQLMEAQYPSIVYEFIPTQVLANAAG